MRGPAVHRYAGTASAALPGLGGKGEPRLQIHLVLEKIFGPLGLEARQLTASKKPSSRESALALTNAH